MASIPSIMRAAALDGFGDPGVLTIHMLPVPVPDAHEILVAVHTAGVGTWDADMRAGWWPEGKPAFPLVLGTDGSGTVVTAGSSVRRLKVGDRVYSYSFANPKGGFYAEYVAAQPALRNRAHFLRCRLGRARVRAAGRSDRAVKAGRSDRRGISPRRSGEGA